MTRTIAGVFEEQHNFGDMKAKIIDVNITSYTTGGEALAAADFGLERLDDVTAIPQGAGFVGQWLNATKLLKIYSGALVEVAATTAVGLVRCKGIGK
jgi:hypothetical protein